MKGSSRAILLLSLSVAFSLLCGLALMLSVRPLSVKGDSPPVIEVTSTAYDGPGTLRRALWQAISGTTIIFDPAVFPPTSPQTIIVTRTLQFWTNGVTVDASNAGVILDGSQAGPSINGLELYYDRCILQGLTIRNFPSSGIQIAPGADENTIGGDRNAGAGPNGQGNLIVGNEVDGIKIQGSRNRVQGNLIGVERAGQSGAGNAAYGVSLTNGASDNVIGSAAAQRGNIISGNGQHGVYIGGGGAAGNQVIGNLIGVGYDGLSDRGNGGAGVFLASGAHDSRIGGAAAGAGNTIAHNLHHGVVIFTCDGNTVARNTIHSNGGQGIRHESTCLAAPVVKVASVGTDESVTGTAAAGAVIDVFSDDEDEGRSYAGSTTADSQGHFWFTAAGAFRYTNVMATSTDAAGNTSELSAPAHLAWTMLLYVNGDNDLQDLFLEAFDELAEAGPGPQTNVLALVDGYQGPRGGSALYDITRGASPPLTETATLTREVNMGAGQTLVNFVNWGRAVAPARHTLLAIIDHGGGWTATSTVVPGALPRRGRDYLGGNSGLSWDFTSAHDYLDSSKMRAALSAITGDGAQKLDVLFYDVCLMGMVEVAYQIQPYADYFISSQNIGWAPVGEGGRYVRAVQGIGPATAPAQVAELLVQAYDAGFAAEGRPFTAAAVDLALLPGVVDAADGLARAILNTSPLPAAALHQAYAASQKLDYDTDFRIEPETDGMVDLYDFAEHAAAAFTQPAIVSQAQGLVTALDAAIVASRTVSGPASVVGDVTWDLEDANALSIFLPLGEDLILPITITTSSLAAVGPTSFRYLHLRELYSCTQLRFACDTQWDELIAAYYAALPVASAARAPDTPLEGLLDPRSPAQRGLWLPLIMRKQPGG